MRPESKTTPETVKAQRLVSEQTFCPQALKAYFKIWCQKKDNMGLLDKLFYAGLIVPALITGLVQLLGGLLMNALMLVAMRIKN